MTTKEADWKSIKEAPEEWLKDVAYGNKDLISSGLALFVNKKQVKFITIDLIWTVDSCDVRIWGPEVKIDDDADVSVVTRIGSFVLWRGKGGDLLDIGDNPEVQDVVQDVVQDKAKKAMEKLGVAADQF